MSGRAVTAAALLLVAFAAFAQPALAAGRAGSGRELLQSATSCPKQIPACRDRRCTVRTLGSKETYVCLRCKEGYVPVLGSDGRSIVQCGESLSGCATAAAAAAAAVAATFSPVPCGCQTPPCTTYWVTPTTACSRSSLTGPTLTCLQCAPLVPMSLPECASPAAPAATALAATRRPPAPTTTGAPRTPAAPLA
jgi:hypothetical protein